MKKKREEIRYMIILAVLLLIGYFFTWKNFQEYQEKKGEIEEESSKNVLEKVRKKELEQEKAFLEKSLFKKKEEKKREEKKDQKIVPFHHIIEFEDFLLKNLEMHSLELLSISRVIFDGNFLKIPLEFQGKWNSLFSFLGKMEENQKTVFVAKQYLKMEAINGKIGKVRCTFVIQVEERENFDVDFLNIDKDSQKKPYVRLGGTHVYF